MRPKPLKSAEYYVEELYYGEGDGNRIKVFTEDDVKSAVEWLLQEIDKLESEHIDDDGNSSIVIIPPFADDVKKKIKEAFADVVDEEVGDNNEQH